MPYLRAKIQKKKHPCKRLMFLSAAVLYGYCKNGFIYRVSTVYLPCIYRVCTVMDVGR